MTGSWVMVVVCVVCGDRSLHVELSEYDDEPHGLPPDLPCPGCGTTGSLAPATMNRAERRSLGLRRGDYDRRN